MDMMRFTRVSSRTVLKRKRQRKNIIATNECMVWQQDGAGALEGERAWLACFLTRGVTFVVTCWREPNFDDCFVAVSNPLAWNALLLSTQSMLYHRRHLVSCTRLQ